MTSDGTIRIDDTLRSSSDPIFDPIGSIEDASLAGVLDSPQATELATLTATLPSACNGCIWAGICGGGRIVNRYDRVHRFENKSIYCEAMRMLLGRGAAHLMANGITEDQISENIG